MRGGARHFNRWSPALGKTWAFRLFERHHTEINDLYWAHAAALRKAFSSCKKNQLSDPCDSVFHLKPEHARRLPGTLKDWADKYNSFDNWTRLSCLVAATGYLEVYIKTAIRLALESDPGVMVGCSRKIDGAQPLKKRPRYSYKDEAAACVKGDWQSRIAAYKRLFGECPAVIENSIVDLEFVRRTRNGVAHAFGRGIDDYDSLAQAKPRELTTLKEERFTRILGLIEEIAKALETHLGQAHIGDYETIYFFHHWLKDNPFVQKTDKALRIEFVRLHNNTVGKPYCTELRAYYAGL
jgi:hypothetical protein